MIAAGSQDAEQAWADLWLFDLQMQSAQLMQGGQQFIDAATRSRASSFVSVAHANAFLASHAALRLVLSDYGCTGRETFELGPNGKPFVPGAPHFNLSRTRHAVMVAVSNADVGIDIEFRRTVEITEPKIYEVGTILRRVGWPADTLQSWTATEAWVKYRGLTMRQVFEDDTTVLDLANDLATGRAELTPLILPPHLCGTVCTGSKTTLNYVARSVGAGINSDVCKV